MAAAQVMSLDQTTFNLLRRWIDNPMSAGTNYRVLKHTVGGKDVELVVAGDNNLIVQGTTAQERPANAVQGLYSTDRGRTFIQRPRQGNILERVTQLNG
jgi:hypothetical protein